MSIESRVHEPRRWGYQVSVGVRSDVPFGVGVLAEQPTSRCHTGLRARARQWFAGSRSAALVLGACLLVAGCGHGGQYGYARTYKPLPDEKSHFRSGESPSYQDVLREPNAHEGTTVAWFGVVQRLGSLPDGRTRLFLELRAHQPRHLCAETSSSSCRVTVSARNMGPFLADITQRADEGTGRLRLWEGSLVKIYGKPTGEVDAEGGPLFDVAYYRHWPKGYYVTTAHRDSMRL